MQFCKGITEVSGAGIVNEKIFYWEPRQEVVWLLFKWCRHSIPEESCHYSR